MRRRTWRRTCGGRAPHGPGVDPPGRIAGIGVVPPATSGSPSPDLPICAVRASFPASAAAPGHQSQELPPISGEEKEMTEHEEVGSRSKRQSWEGKGGSLA
jgi:hypothetical protein